jgi:broad specificity phosphatase PhoE
MLYLVRHGETDWDLVNQPRMIPRTNLDTTFVGGVSLAAGSPHDARCVP